MYVHNFAKQCVTKKYICLLAQIQNKHYEILKCDLLQLLVTFCLTKIFVPEQHKSCTATVDSVCPFPRNMSQSILFNWGIDALCCPFSITWFPARAIHKLEVLDHTHRCTQKDASNIHRSVLSISTNCFYFLSVSNN